MVLAARNGHTEVVRLLLEKGAEVNTNIPDVATTANWTASQGGTEEID